MTEIDWSRLNRLEGDVLRREAFGALRLLSERIHEVDQDDVATLSAVPRLAELIDSRPELRDYRSVLSTLARAVGLWNYIDPERGEARDRLLAETASVDVGRHIVLHREQVEALNVLLSGRNLVLSAPTSFGKSLLVDVLLSTGRYQNVAIILPTIALLDEFRRRLTERFGAEFDILMHHSDRPRRANKAIFLGTQERLINREDIPGLDLLVVDEFYKLDPHRKDDRSLVLNAAVYKLIRKSRQFFFLGPNIEGVRFDPEGRWKFEFLRTKFSTVAVDTIDLRNSGDRYELLQHEVFDQSNWPALVFVSGPDAANSLAKRLGGDSSISSAKAKALAAWISDNYGSHWDLASVVASGIGLHHGRIPRSLAAIFVRMFNDDDRPLPVLLCTSTLIEGVNTAAKSVLIYDKVINRTSYDFFTFSNIKGRAGRLGEHHIGKVFLFHSPPREDQVEVAPPVLQDLDEAPDELVVHVEEEDRGPISASRVEDLSRLLGLPLTDIRRLSALGFDTLLAIKEATERSLRRAPQRLIFRGFAEYESLTALCDIAWEVAKRGDLGAASSAQLNRYIRKLRQAPSLRWFFEDYNESIGDYADRYENIFRFLRACEHSLPEIFTAVERFVRSMLPAMSERVDYALLTGELARWFRPEVLKVLEERGIPIQIAERFHRAGDTLEVLEERLRAAVQQSEARLSTLERDWITASLPAPSAAVE